MSADQTELELRERARMLVRAQLVDTDAQLEDLEAAVRAALPHTDAGILARAWHAAERKRLAAEAAGWERPTDHERLTAALDECRAHDVVVVLGVTDPQHLRTSVATALTERAGETPLRGVVWASEPDVFHAVDHGVLDLRPLRPDAAPAVEGDHFVGAVRTCLERHGLRVRFHAERLQVALRWRATPR